MPSHAPTPPPASPEVRLGALQDLVGLMVTPLMGGLPSPVDARAARRSEWSRSGGCGCRAGSG